MTLAALLLATVVGLAGVAIVGDELTRPRDEPASPSTRSWRVGHRSSTTGPSHAVRALVAVVLCALVIAASAWVVPAIVVGAGAWWATGSWSRHRRRDGDDLARIDALASWIENLRDVLVAGDQPIGAIAHTVETCPAAIRPQVRRLAVGLQRQDPEIVFRRFADEIDDPIGDLAAAGLLIAVRRGGRTVAVLSALAEQARAQSDRRRLVIAERAPARREVAALSLIMVTLLAGLFVFARSDYLAPYGSPSGQVVLSLALIAFAGLLMRVQQLARFPGPARFLSLPGDLRGAGPGVRS